MDMKLTDKSLTLDDVWSILSLVEDATYHADTKGAFTYHYFEVHWGEDVHYGDDDVTVEAGTHRLLLDTYTNEWIGYQGPSD